jgi:hypothetical protein
MKPKSSDMVQKVHDALIENEYQTAAQLAERCGLETSSIYRIVRMMRLQGIGVLPTKNGYVLSEFAKKSDDVGFIRRCYGRRTSDIIAIQAAANDINGRWNKVEDKTNLKLLLAPLSIDVRNSKGMKILLSYKNSKGM